MSDRFEIREYSEADLPALAVHWKESVKGWPAGFDAGGDYSPEGIREWLLRREFIAIWLGWVDDVIVSYLSYAVRSSDPDATYVELFNTHPDYKGKGYGRRLMTHCLDIAIRDRVKRVDLHTWSANTQAVPLYKKTGFFWRPRVTWTHMYNFLPTVINNPLVAEFLGDTWWYDALRQNLELKENDELYNGCPYHRYTFELNGRQMTVDIDPSTSGITAIETDDYSIRMDIPGLTHVSGLPQDVNLSLRNSKESPVMVKVNCSTRNDIEYKHSDEFELMGEKTLNSTIIPPADPSPELEPWYGKIIDCEIKWNDTVFHLRPGIRAVKPFRFDPEPNPLRLAPGETGSFVLKLSSLAQNGFSYTPEISCSDNLEIVNDIDTSTRTVPAEDAFGIPVTIRAADEPGPSTLTIGGTLEADGNESRIHPITVNARIAPLGQPVEVLPVEPLNTTLSNGYLTITVRRKGGNVNIYDARTGNLIMYFDHDLIGEPFAQDLSGRIYDLEVIENGHTADIILTTESANFPGVKLEKRFRLGSGYECEMIVGFHNHSAKPFDGRAKIHIRNFAVTSMTIPLRDRIVTGGHNAWLEANRALPPDPSEYAEPWVCMTLSGDSGEGDVNCGLLIDGVERTEWAPWQPFEPEWTSGVLDPGESMTCKPLKILAGVKDWKEVQQAALNDKPSKLPMNSRPHIHTDSPIFADDNSADVNFRMFRYTAQTGSVKVSIPGSDPVTISGDNWNMDNSLTYSFTNPGNLEPGLHGIDYEVESMSITRSGRFPLLIPSGNTGITISDEMRDSYRIYTVNNGVIEFKVAPEYAGTVVSLAECADPDLNLLRTPFPEKGMWVWWNPFFGGICPIIETRHKYDRFSFDGEPVRVNWNGFDWEGIRVDVKPIRDLQSLRYQVFWLTRPGYPVILELLRFTELNGLRHLLNATTMIASRPSGDPMKPSPGVVGTDKGISKILESEQGSCTEGGRWAAVTDPESGRTHAVVVNDGFAIIWDAAKDGNMMFAEGKIRTDPEVPVERAVLHLVTDGTENIDTLANEFRYFGSRAASGVEVSDTAPVKT